MVDASLNASYRNALRYWRGRLVWQTALASVFLIAANSLTAAAVIAGAAPLWLGTLIAFVVAHAGFTVLHEASHKSISGGAPGLGFLDPLLGTIHAALLVYDLPTFRFLHMRHHVATNDPARDPDYWLQRLPLWAVLVVSPLVPLHYLRLYTAAFRDGAVPRREFARAVVNIGLLMTLLLIALIVWPAYTFFLWLLPASLASVVISFSHRMLHSADVTPDRRKTTRIIHGDAIFEWLICPFFWLNNHHLLHHESPKLPVLAHNKLYAELKSDLIAGGAYIVQVGGRPHNG